MDPHRLAELRSLAYHRAVAERLDREPALVEKARDRVARWIAEGGAAAPYARCWQALLDGRREALCAALVEDSEGMRALRQATPFAGALDARERWALWRAVAAEAAQ